jgi:hypothetical protein
MLHLCLVSKQFDSVRDEEILFLGKPDWVPTSLVLLHNEPELLRAVVARVLHTGGTPGESWYATLALQSERLLAGPAGPAESVRGRDRWQRSMGERLRYDGYCWLMTDAVQRALPLYHGGHQLEMPRRFAENAFRSDFEQIRRQCEAYLEAVCREATAAVATSGIAVDGLLVQMPDYAPHTCIVSVMP